MKISEDSDAGATTASSADQNSTNAVEYTHNPSLVTAVATLIPTESAVTELPESSTASVEVTIEDVEDDSTQNSCDEDMESLHTIPQPEDKDNSNPLTVSTGLLSSCEVWTPKTAPFKSWQLGV